MGFHNSRSFDLFRKYKVMYSKNKICYVKFSFGKRNILVCQMFASWHFVPCRSFREVLILAFGMGCKKTTSLHHIDARGSSQGGGDGGEHGDDEVQDFLPKFFLHNS